MPEDALEVKFQPDAAAIVRAFANLLNYESYYPGCCQNRCNVNAIGVSAGLNFRLFGKQDEEVLNSLAIAAAAVLVASAAETAPDRVATERPRHRLLPPAEWEYASRRCVP